MAAVATEQVVGSPSWWVNRLYKALVARQPALEFYDQYYTGDHPLPWLAPQARTEFRRILTMTRSNFMGLVVDSTAERVRVEGFRFGADAGADDRTWQIWQHNNLDSDSDIAWLESLIGGTSYFLVAPNSIDPELPHVWVEHASQAIVEYQPGSNRRTRAAGLKAWLDDWTGQLCVTLYLLVDGRLRVFKYQAETSSVTGSSLTVAGGSPRWVPRQVAGEDWGELGGMDVIPLIEVPNNPRLLTGGRSELYDLTDIQDRISKTLADRMMTQDFGAFPQKWATGWPDTDEDGNANTIDIGRNRMVTTDVTETRLGQWEAAPLDPYSFAKREDIKDIASRSRTPAQYLLGEMSNVNGETLKASESGLIAKVRQRMRPWGEAAEEAMRIARTLAGIGGPTDARMETVFSDPEFRTEGEKTDAAVKRLQSGIASKRQARTDVGYTLTQIAQLESDDLKEGADPMIAHALRSIINPAPLPGVPGRNEPNSV